MKTMLVLLMLVCSAAFSQSDSIDLWLPYNDALEKSKKDGKIVLVEFYAKWCIPCHEMEKTVFKDPEVLSELKSNFHFVKLDIEKKDTILCESELLPIQKCVRNWELGGIPAFAVIGEDGSMRHLSIGDYKKKSFLIFLNALKNKEKGKN